MGKSKRTKRCRVRIVHHRRLILDAEAHSNRRRQIPQDSGEFRVAVLQVPAAGSTQDCRAVQAPLTAAARQHVFAKVLAQAHEGLVGWVRAHGYPSLRGIAQIQRISQDGCCRTGWTAAIVAPAELSRLVGDRQLPRSSTLSLNNNARPCRGGARVHARSVTHAMVDTVLIGHAVHALPADTKLRL